MASPLARRYADAYFALAKEHGKIDEWGRELKRAQETIEDPRLTEALGNPRIRRQDRIHLAMDLLDGVDKGARNLVRLMLEHGRIKLLGEVVEHYDELKQRASGITRGVVYSAEPMGKDEANKIALELSKKLGQKIEVEVRQDAEIIGGLVIHIGDRVIDTSVRTRLQQLQESFA